ncbi:hypothetical protein FQN50_000420 [Emmonsiellopsis sp. PD_5]|nr:hypothetical protein FQN50_000420 [Emmonsiellopsis sp. PD_5]
MDPNHDPALDYTVPPVEFVDDEDEPTGFVIRNQPEGMTCEELQTILEQSLRSMYPVTPADAKRYDSVFVLLLLWDVSVLGMDMIQSDVESLARVFEVLYCYTVSVRKIPTFWFEDPQAWFMRMLGDLTGGNVKDALIIIHYVGFGSQNKQSQFLWHPPSNQAPHHANLRVSLNFSSLKDRLYEADCDILFLLDSWYPDLRSLGEGKELICAADFDPHIPALNCAFTNAIANEFTVAALEAEVLTTSMLFARLVKRYVDGSTSLRNPPVHTWLSLRTQGSIFLPPVNVEGPVGPPTRVGRSAHVMAFARPTTSPIEAQYKVIMRDATETSPDEIKSWLKEKGLPDTAKVDVGWFHDGGTLSWALLIPVEVSYCLPSNISLFSSFHGYFPPTPKPQVQFDTINDRSEPYDESPVVKVVAGAQSGD